MSKATLVGKVVGALISNGMTFWAAVETRGLVHSVLVCQLVLSAVVFIAYGVVAMAKREATKARSLYGDVHIQGAVDVDRLRAAMSRTGGIDGLPRA